MLYAIQRASSVNTANGAWQEKKSLNSSIHSPMIDKATKVHASCRCAPAPVNAEYTYSETKR